MVKLLKRLLWVVAVLVILVIGAVIAVPLVIEPRDVADELAARVKQQTGRDLVIAGEPQLSLFPWLGVDVSDLTLSQPAGFGSEPFAGIGKAQLRVRLMPLLSKRLEMDTVVLSAVRLNLVRRADGVTNFDDLTALAGGGAARRSSTESPPASAGGAAGHAQLAGLAVGGLNLLDAQVVWDDRQAGRRYAVSDFSLETGALSPGATAPVVLQGRVTAAEPAAEVDVGFSGNVTLAADQTRLQLADMVLRLNGGAAMVRDLAAVLAGDFDLDLAARRVTGDAVTLTLEGLAERSDGTLPWSLAARLALDMTDRAVRLNGIRVQANGDLPVAGDAPRSLSASLGADAHIDLAEQTLAVTQLSADLLGVQLAGEINGRNLFADARYQGMVQVAPFNPKTLLAALGRPALATADPTALTRLSLSTRFNAGYAAVSLSRLVALLDDTELTGEVNVRSFDGPVADFDLAVNDLDADRYLPPPADDRQPADADAVASDDALLSPLRTLNLNGELRVGQFVIKRLKASDVTVRVNARQGVVRVNPAKAKLYGGSASNTLMLDARGDEPVVTAKVALVGVNADPLLTDLGKKASPISGTMHFDGDLRTRGLGAQSTQNLNGALNFAFLNGAYQGVNVAYELRRAEALFRGQAAPENTMNQTDFTEMTGSATVINGVLHNQDLNVASPLLRIQGAGVADLRQQQADYTLTVNVVNTATGQGGKSLDNLRGLRIPVAIRGPFDQPDIAVDVDKLLTAQAKQRLQQKVQEQVDKTVQEKLDGAIGEQLGDKLPGLFKGLFGD